TEHIVERDNPFGLLDRAAHDVTRPILSRFDARGGDGAALLIIPGGGYSWVVIDKEGFEGARWFSRRGLTVYVLRHRLPHQGWAAGADTPLQDAQRAMRVIRARAAQDGIDPQRVAVMGFSAGGHVAGSLATRFAAPVYDAADAADAQSARPDAAALMYPVATMREAHAHPGSRRNLLGETPSEARIAAYSLETAPPADTPATFLMHAADDPSVPVENSLGLFAALRAAGVPSEMHIFERGGHGFGLRGLDGNTAHQWPDLFLAWARMRGVLR
ncbi:MAG: alpha/beta hydrolase, partial [Hyphomonadaceae bacterium]